MSNLEKYLNKPVSELVAPSDACLVEPMMERHAIYSLLVMAGILEYWCGNKYGRDAHYPLNPSSKAGDAGKYLDTDYLGHNIACIAVDAEGYVIDFDFNHNTIFNSSVEHAESRLIQRVFALTQIHESWKTSATSGPTDKYGNVLRDVSVYTSLESCSQCSGIMALGQIKEVIYLQQDPGMYLIGNILRRLTEGTELQAPLPIAGSEFKFDYFQQLNSRYQAFAEQQRSESGDPFVVFSSGKKRYTSSITSFLCTRSAFGVFAQAANKFENFEVKYADFQPTDWKGNSLGKSLTNDATLKEAQSFLKYMKEKGRRGTPHH